ncbi:MAG: hypothetical protein A4E28_02876 [Methanocella sp. PtaU1.Bin125]|nr:MAG: hypothetical protein A4E28_02876 [Methanocella sp. PtaU1.Bin125]
MSSKPLARGSPLGGPSDSKIVISLVIVCVVLAAIAFALFAANQSQDKSSKDMQAELDAIQLNLSQTTLNLTMLKANYSSLAGQLVAANANYEDVTARYLALQNKSNTVDTRLNTFLEDAPTIAYFYEITSRQLTENQTAKVVTITAYNLGKTDAGRITMMCSVKAGNATTVYNQTFLSVMSLDKRVHSWEFSNDTTIVEVWAGLS